MIEHMRENSILNDECARRLTVTTVRIDGLEQTEGDPDVHGEDVEVSGDGAVEDGTDDSACAEDEDFGGVSVFCGETEWRGVLVVDLVNVLIQRSPVECLMGCEGKNTQSRLFCGGRKVRHTVEVEDILEDEEDQDLRDISLP